MATKFEAFADRGQNDLLTSHDLEDIVNVVASRSHLIEEIAQSPADLRKYLAARCQDLLAVADFSNYLPGLIQDDSYGQQTDEVLNRLEEIVKLRERQ